jgi:hypothetical protein
MARIPLTVQTVNRSGVAETFSAANTDGHWVANDGRTWLEVINGGGGAVTVSVQTPGTVDSLAVSERQVSVPAGGRRKIGPWPPSLYNQVAGDIGTIYVDYSGVSSVTVAAFGLEIY